MQEKKSTGVKFSERLRELSSEKGLKQRNIADLCGVSEASASKWFNGGKISAENALTISKFFGVSMESLLGINAAPAFCINESPVKYSAQNFKQMYLEQKARADHLERELKKITAIIEKLKGTSS